MRVSWKNYSWESGHFLTIKLSRSPQHAAIIRACKIPFADLQGGSITLSPSGFMYLKIKDRLIELIELQSSVESGYRTTTANNEIL